MDAHCPPGESLLRVGNTCSAVEPADKAVVLVDNEAYFRAAAAVIRNARRSIWLLGWEFEPRTALKPAAPAGERDEIGDLLKRVAEEQPGLRVRVLIWDAALPVSAGLRLMPQRAQEWFDQSPVEFRLDSSLTKGASHHQKLLIVDDAIAFCSGTDFTANRWDRPEHLDRDPDRVTLSGNEHAPRHASTMLVSGDAAKPLADLARERWERCTGERVPAEPRPGSGAAWPEGIEPDFRDVPVGLSRTFPGNDPDSEIRENEALYLAGIGAARRLLYFENQYFTSPVIGDAIANRLAEPNGPEIVVINGEHAPNPWDRVTMDSARDSLVTQLQEADRFGRFHAYAPHSPGGTTILVHSKLMIVDDRFIRVGSSNLANRSLGYDTECDIAMDVEGEENSRAISAVLFRLIAHFAGCGTERAEEAISSARMLSEAIDRLDQREPRRLRPLSPGRPRFPRSVIADHHLGDPLELSQAWRPWRGGRD